MHPGLLDPSSDPLSAHLSEIAEKLQLDRRRYERAESAYRGVGTYLESQAPPAVQLQVGPQGSMLIQTTVAPRRREEHDLDILALLMGPVAHVSPQQLYDWGLNLLQEHGVYKKILEPKSRCVRLNYQGDFHLDVLFAIPDPSPDTDARSILVPDRRLRGYARSNPWGFASWFEGQCEVEALERKRSEVSAQAPLPSNDPAHLKALLKQIVQLVKRSRDTHFDGAESAPRSIVLTTLAARKYLGARTLYEGLVSVAEQFVSEIKAAHAQKRRLVVLNPTNEHEDFSECWDKNASDYRKAIEWMVGFRDRVRALADLKGPRLTHELKALFGEDVVERAHLALADRFNRQRRASSVRSTGRSLVVGGGTGTVVRPHHFYGGDNGGT